MRINERLSPIPKMATLSGRRRLARRFARRMRYKRRLNIGRGRVSKKAVRRIAAQVVRRDQETKKAHHATTLIIVPDAVYIFNPMYQLGQGVEMNQYIGQKVQNVWLRVDWAFWPILENTFATTIDWQGCLLRFLFFKSNVKTGTTAGTRFQNGVSGLGAGELFELGTFPAIEAVNKEYVSLVKDVKVRATRIVSTNATSGTPEFGIPIRGTFNVRIAKIWQYEQDGTGFGRNRQFYFAVTSQMINAVPGASTSGNLQLMISTVYKDA
jgi:hypothetical protein